MADAEQAGFCSMRQTKRGHGLARRCGKAQCFSGALKDVSLGNTAGVTLIDGSTQRGKFRLEGQ